jgi:long-chain-acyl-CoA dehydrogenase
MLPVTDRAPYGAEHEMFRESVRRLFQRELLPNLDRWEAEGIMDRAFWRSCGEAGLLAPQVPEAYGGPGLDFGYAAIVGEELFYAGAPDSLTLHSDVAVDYIIAYGSEDQKRRWLPRIVSGETVLAIGMTEPGAGSDLKAIRTTARRDGDDFVINGSKTYITNGQIADLVILIVKTDPESGAKGMSLMLVEADRPGFERGRNLDKIGIHGSDTSELLQRGPGSVCEPIGRGEQGLRLSDVAVAPGAALHRHRLPGRRPAGVRRGGRLRQAAQGFRPGRV